MKIIDQVITRKIAAEKGIFAQIAFITRSRRYRFLRPNLSKIIDGITSCIRPSNIT
jgi:hypothetical protein